MRFSYNIEVFNKNNRKTPFRRCEISKSFEQVCTEIDNGTMTIDEINNTVWDFRDDVDFEYLDSKIAYFDVYQMALKIAMNSLYGALANVHFPLFNRDIAASITGNGRIFIQGLANYVNDKLQRTLGSKTNFVIYGDTDSVYFTLDELVKTLQSKDADIVGTAKILDKVLSFDKKLMDPWVQEYIDIYSDTFNAFNAEPIGAKLEKIADKGMFIAKKKYALRAVWDEGSFLVEHPKMAVTGLEIVRSSTPMFCRKELKKAIDIILDHDEKSVINFINESESKWMKESINNISRVSGIGTLDYQGDIGSYHRINENGKSLTAPMNVRAAMNHNAWVDEKKLSSYAKITAEDKIKYCFLVHPNPLGDDVVGYIDEKFLVDAGLYKYVDKSRMWDNFFMSPLNIMLEAVQYDINTNFEIDEWM